MSDEKKYIDVDVTRNIVDGLHADDNILHDLTGWSNIEKIREAFKDARERGLVIVPVFGVDIARMHLIATDVFKITDSRKAAEWVAAQLDNFVELIHNLQPGDVIVSENGIRISHVLVQGVKVWDINTSLDRQEAADDKH